LHLFEKALTGNGIVPESVTAIKIFQCNVSITLK